MFSDFIVYLDESGDDSLDVIAPQYLIFEERKAPVFTGARRRPGIPDPFVSAIGNPRQVVKGIPFVQPSGADAPDVHHSTTTEGERR
jgi:hypothetical protein